MSRFKQQTEEANETMSNENQPPTPPMDPLVYAPLSRRVEVEICADCSKYARVFICPSTPDARPNNEGISVRPGTYRCRKDHCGNCFPYPYPLNEAAKDVLVKPMLTAETQVVAAITGLTIDIESQDEIRKVAGTCGACLVDVAALLHDKHHFDVLKTEPWDISCKQVRDILTEAKKELAAKHRNEHRPARHLLFPRVIKFVTEPEAEFSIKPANGYGGKGKAPLSAQEKAEIQLEQIGKLENKTKLAREEAKAAGGKKQSVNLDGSVFECPICECEKLFTFDGLNIHLSHCLGMDYPNLKLTRARIMTWMMELQAKKQQTTAAVAPLKAATKTAKTTPAQAYKLAKAAENGLTKTATKAAEKKATKTKVVKAVKKPATAAKPTAQKKQAKEIPKKQTAPPAVKAKPTKRPAAAKASSPVQRKGQKIKMPRLDEEEENESDSDISYYSIPTTSDEEEEEESSIGSNETYDYEPYE